MSNLSAIVMGNHLAKGSTLFDYIDVNNPFRFALSSDESVWIKISKRRYQKRDDDGHPTGPKFSTGLRTAVYRAE